MRWRIARMRSRMFVAVGEAFVYGMVEIDAFELVREIPAILVQLTGTVNVVVPVTVAVKVAVMLGLKVPPVTPVMFTKSPVARPWALVVVIVQGLPVLMEEIEPPMSFRMAVLAPLGN